MFYPSTLIVTIFLLRFLGIRTRFGTSDITSISRAFLISHTTNTTIMTRLLRSALSATLITGLTEECFAFNAAPRHLVAHGSSFLARHCYWKSTTALNVVVEESTTVQDDTISDPASVVFYDDFLDPANPQGVVCARGVCVLPDFDDDFDLSDPSIAKKEKSIVDKFLNSYLGPRALLAFASILYGTNFPLGAMMNEALPPSAATSARMLLASLALSPFLFKLEPTLAPTALLGGCFVAMGYITQSLSLVDTSPATVAFLGAATVVVCPALEYFVYKKPMGVKDAPQTWLAATLCLVGVGVLELYDPTGATAISDVFSQVGFGDVLALAQAVGFGTSFFLTEKMMTEVPGQALPITGVQVSVSAFFCMLWSLSDGWIGSAGAASYGLPAMFFEPSLQSAAFAVVWTGVITTALNRFFETSALGKMKSAEASVILATEPLWAAFFASLWLSEDFGANDYIGGALIVAACLATALQKDDFDFLFGEEAEKGR